MTTPRRNHPLWSSRRRLAVCVAGLVSLMRGAQPFRAVESPSAFRFGSHSCQKPLRLGPSCCASDRGDDSPEESSVPGAEPKKGGTVPGFLQTRHTSSSSSRRSSSSPRRVRRVARLKPTVAVVGRPNVGKSTLANRMCDAAGPQKGAIVMNEPGVTRDRVYKAAEWCGRFFDVVDTGGLVFDDAEGVFAEEIRAQAAIALGEACAVVMVVDGREGRVGLDDDIAAFLRRTRFLGEDEDRHKKSLLKVVAVNKCENVATEVSNAADFWGLGLGEPFACSAVHGNGVAEVLDALLPAIDADVEAKRTLAFDHHHRRKRRADGDDDGGTKTKDHVVYDSDDDDDTTTESESSIAVTLIGRPNVGKSSLLNRFVGDETRAIVSEVAGTTRDAIDEAVEVDGTVFKFVDTAGVRRRRSVKDGSTEEAMVGRALRAVRRADVVLLVLDATVEFTDQDAALARRIKEDGRACVVLVNKWDIKDDKDDMSTVKVKKALKEKLADVHWADVAFVSAKTGQRCLKVYAAARKAAANHRKKIPTPVLNDVVRDAVRWQAPPATAAGKGSGKIYYVSQIATRPPAFLAVCNDPKLFTENYKRYLERKLREALDFDGTPIRLLFRGKRLRQEERDAAKRRAAAKLSAKKGRPLNPAPAGYY